MSAEFLADLAVAWSKMKLKMNNNMNESAHFEQFLTDQNSLLLTS